MSKLAIIATIEVAADCRDKVLPLLMAHKRRCLEDEPGTLEFEVLVPHDDASKILLYELYEDGDAFQAHWNGASAARVREETGNMIVKIYGTKCALSE